MLGLVALKELPAIYKIAAVLGVLLLIGIAFGVVYAKGLSRGEASCQAAQAKAVLEAQQKADKLANSLLEAQAAAMAETQKTVTVYQDRIVHAPPTHTCGAVVRDAATGVLQIIRGNQADRARTAPVPLH